MKKWFILILVFSAGCNYGSNNGPSAAKRGSARPAYDVKADPKANRKITSVQWQAEVLDSKELVLVDFWAPWCRPCLAMTDTIEDLAQEIKVVKVNVDNNPNLKRQYGVDGIPMLVFFQNGQIAMKFTSYTEERDLREAISHLKAKKTSKQPAG